MKQKILINFFFNNVYRPDMYLNSLHNIKQDCIGLQISNFIFAK